MSNNENLIRAKTHIIKSASHRINYSKSAPLRLPDLVKKKNNEKQELIQYSFKVKQKLELLKKQKNESDSSHLKEKSIQRPKKTIQTKSLTAKYYKVKLTNFKGFLNRIKYEFVMANRARIYPNFELFFFFFVKSTIRFYLTELQNELNSCQWFDSFRKKYKNS